MSRAQAEPAEPAKAHGERLRRAQERSVRVLTCKAAQSPDAPTMGTHLEFDLIPATGRMRGLRVPVPDPEELAVAAMLARPFILSRESIHGPQVSRSLVAFATTDEQRRTCEQVGKMWRALPRNRMTHFAARLDGTPVLPVGGVDDGEIADRVLYSQLVHADDARDVLEHVDTTHRQWSLAALVGDWIAVVAHQQAVLHWVRPDLCEALTPWHGSPQTVFKRWGADPMADTPS